MSLWREDKEARCLKGHRRNLGGENLTIIRLSPTTWRVVEPRTGLFTEWDGSAWRVRCTATGTIEQAQP